MIDLVHGFRLLMQRDDRFRDVVDGDNIDAVGRSKRQEREACEKNERADHIKLRCFGAAAVAQHDAGSKDSARHLRKEFAYQMLTEFFGARVRIVVGTIPIDRSVLAYNFVAASSRYGDSRNLAESPQTVCVLGAARQLRDLEGPSKIYVKAAFFRLPGERCGAVNDRMGRPDQTSVLGRVQTKTRIGKIPSKYRDARFDGVPNLREIQMQLQRVPEARVRLLFSFRAHQQIQPIGMAIEQNCGDMRADVAGRTGQKNGHG